MSRVIIKIDTGFAGAGYEVDSGYTTEEWSVLSENKKDDEYRMAISEHIGCYAEDEEGNIIE